jgi:hypothetical protein
MKLGWWAGLSLVVGISGAPAAAQDSGDAADEQGERRYFAPALPDWGPKDRPKPLTSWESWVTNADYPLESWRNGEEGLVQYDLAVDPTGKASDCTITYSTASPALNAETCRLLLERASFEPGVDKQDRPIASVYAGEVVWQKREPEYSGTFTIKVTYTIDERGEQKDCRIVEQSGAVPASMQRSLQRRPCPSNPLLAGIPYRDENGAPVAREVTVTLNTTVGDLPVSD